MHRVLEVRQASAAWESGLVHGGCSFAHAQCMVMTGYAFVHERTERSCDRQEKQGQDIQRMQCIVHHALSVEETHARERPSTWKRKAQEWIDSY